MSAPVRPPEHVPRPTVRATVAMAQGARYADLRWLRGLEGRGRLIDDEGER